MKQKHYPESISKFMLVQKVLGRFPKRPVRILDVGCRGCELEQYLGDATRYFGMDIFVDPERNVDIVADAEQGIPLKDNSLHVSIALDVLEHMDDFQEGLTELLRVSSDGMLVAVPNMAHIFFRKQFLLYGELSNKYKLKYNASKDRHRWIPVLGQTDEYMATFAEENSLALHTYWFNNTPKKALLARACKAIGLPPSLWVWHSLYVFLKNDIAVSL